jgi:hypothetical protein
VQVEIAALALEHAGLPASAGPMARQARLSASLAEQGQQRLRRCDRMLAPEATGRVDGATRACCGGRQAPQGVLSRGGRDRCGGEALALAGRRDEAVAPVASVREAHRRRRAFCGELDSSADSSAIVKKAPRG